MKDKCCAHAFKAYHTFSFSFTFGFYRNIIHTIHQSLAQRPACLADKNKLNLTYSDAGVDIDRENALIEEIAPHAKRTKQAGANTDLGGFGAFLILRLPDS